MLSPSGAARGDPWKGNAVTTTENQYHPAQYRVLRGVSFTCYFRLQTDRLVRNEFQRELMFSRWLLGFGEEEINVKGCCLIVRDGSTRCVSPLSWGKNAGGGKRVWRHQCLRRDSTISLSKIRPGSHSLLYRRLCQSFCHVLHLHPSACASPRLEKYPVTGDSLTN